MSPNSYEAIIYFPAAPVAEFQSLTVLSSDADAALVKSALDDPGWPLQVTVADSRQEREICDIVSKEDVDGVPHYWVQWSLTLVPKSEIWKARALVARSEAGQGKQRGVEKDGRGHRKQTIRQLQELVRRARRNRKGAEVDLGSRCEVDLRWASPRSQ